MNLPDIEAFVALAETGSVNGAARRLNLTQPAMTRRLQSFEAAVGGPPLLDRTVKPPQLTPAGRQVLDQCRRVLAAVATLKRLPGRSLAPAGPFRLGIAHGLGDVVLGSPLTAVRREFPALSLTMLSSWTTDLIDGIRDGSLDCAVGMLSSGHGLPPDVGAALVGHDRIVVVTARGNGGGPVRLADLDGRPWVLGFAGCGHRAALQTALGRVGAALHVTAEAAEDSLQLSLVAQGAGFGLVPLHQLRRHPQRDALEILALDDYDAVAAVAVLYGPVPGSGRLVADFLADRLRSSFIDHKFDA